MSRIECPGCGAVRPSIGGDPESCAACGCREVHLSDEQVEALEAAIVTEGAIHALLLAGTLGVALRDAIGWVRHVEDRLVAEGRLRRSPEEITLDTVRERVAALGVEVLAIQALWDGDTTGWFVNLEAVAAGPWRGIRIATIRCGGDIRLFRGTVPPWPEAERAADLGRQLSETLGLEFHFPSPDGPPTTANELAWWEARAW